MKRQTRLTPAEGGRFAGPVGHKVPPNDADLGFSTVEQAEAANDNHDKKIIDKLKEYARDYHVGGCPKCLMIHRRDGKCLSQFPVQACPHHETRPYKKSGQVICCSCDEILQEPPCL